MTLAHIDKKGWTCRVVEVRRKLFHRIWEDDRTIRVTDHTGTYDSVASCWKLPGTFLELEE